MDIKFDIQFHANGRGKAKCDPNPDYANGKLIDMTYGNPIPSCSVDIPYPAPECGVWIIKCKECDFIGGLTAAGRADDPAKVILQCKNK